MAEYIEKQSAISEILGQPPEAHYPTWYAEQIKAIPPADVRPAVRGEWKKVYADHEAFGVRPFYRYCSKCHEASVHQYNYCPNCGSYNGGDAE